MHVGKTASSLHATRSWWKMCTPFLPLIPLMRQTRLTSSLQFPSHGAVKTLLQHQTQALRQGPEAIQALRQGPEAIQALHQGPEAIQVLRQGPEAIQALRQGPEAIQALRQGPEAIQALHQGPEAIQALHQGQTAGALGPTADVHQAEQVSKIVWQLHLGQWNRLKSWNFQ